MKITSDTIIGDLVASDYRAATIFKRNKIDFCCQGGRTIEQACSHKHISQDFLIEQLESAMREQIASTPDFNSWPIDLLSDYIEKKHHRFVRQSIEDITPFLAKVARVHGERHPELLEVEALFNGAAVELTKHMYQEENVVFPYVRKMMSESNDDKPSMKTVQHPISQMMQEHDVEGERFRKIAELTDNYNPPSDACNTYRVTLALLRDFEDDLHQHIHLENNILFPKALKMEHEMLV